MSFLYHTFFFDPLYNALIILFRVLPWADAGIVVIILTVLVRLLLFPLSRKAVLTQIRMNQIAPDLEKIKENYKNNPEEQARKTLALYQEKKINPFSGIFVILIQLPIIFALYRIFLHFSEINPELLYFFVQAPENINTLFIGMIDLSASSILLAMLAAISTYFQLHVSVQSQKPKSGGSNSFSDNLSRNMQSQMKYFFPVIVFLISYKISAAISLYWFVTNLFSIGQEIVIRKHTKLV